MPTPVYGSVNAPYPEQPYYSRTKEVHWKSIVFGVLTVTVLGAFQTLGGGPVYRIASFHNIYPVSIASLGPYGVDAAIPHDSWTGEQMAFAEFIDSGFVETLGSGGDGAVLGALRFVYLIDFAQLAKDRADLPLTHPYRALGSTLIIRQGWSNLAIPALETGYAYDNKYQLQFYGDPDHFFTGADQTVVARTGSTSGSPPITPRYDETKFIAWNHGATTTHYVAHFDKSGWLTGAPPLSTSLLAEATA